MLIEDLYGNRGKYNGMKTVGKVLKHKDGCQGVEERN